MRLTDFVEFDNIWKEEIFEFLFGAVLFTLKTCQNVF